MIGPHVVLPRDHKQNLHLGHQSQSLKVLYHQKSQQHTPDNEYTSQQTKISLYHQSLQLL